MMKKLLVLMLVFGLASLSQAATIGLYIGGSNEYTGTAGETVTIDLKSDLVCYGFNIMAVEGNAAVATAVTNKGGTATLPTIGTKMTSGGGYLDNYNGVLFDYVAAYATDAEIPQEAGTMIARFTYTISSAWSGSEFWIAPLVAGTHYEYAPSTFDDAQFSYGNIGGEGNVGVTGVHIISGAIPEPATIGLLSLGGLLLRRRKQ